MLLLWFITDSSKLTGASVVVYSHYHCLSTVVSALLRILIRIAWESAVLLAFHLGCFTLCSFPIWCLRLGIRLFRFLIIAFYVLA